MTKPQQWKTEIFSTLSNSLLNSLMQSARKKLYLQRLTKSYRWKQKNHLLTRQLHLSPKVLLEKLSWRKFLQSLSIQLMLETNTTLSKSLNKTHSLVFSQFMSLAYNDLTNIKKLSIFSVFKPNLNTLFLIMLKLDLQCYRKQGVLQKTSFGCSTACNRTELNLQHQRKMSGKTVKCVIGYVFLPATTLTIPFQINCSFNLTIQYYNI